MIKFRKLLSIPFLMLLVLSAVLWLIGRLAHSYTTQIELPITIVTDYDSKMWIDRSQKNVRLIVSADGREILPYKMGFAPRLIIPLSMLKITPDNSQKDPYLYKIDENSLAKAIMRVQNKMKLSMIVDTIQTLHVSRTEFRRVAIRPMIDVVCSNGYMLSRPVALSIDSITIKAPQAVLDTMALIATERLTLYDCHDHLSGSIALVVPRNVIVQNELKIRYDVMCEPYSEKTYTVPIQVRGMPDAITLPSVAQVTARVPLTKYNSTDVPMVSIDPQKRTLSGFYPIVVDESPSGAVVSGIKPMMAEYFIEKTTAQ
ncbi:MAG: hypothetical protein RR752_05110 [Mucinivorans sp.]